MHCVDKKANIGVAKFKGHCVLQYLIDGVILYLNLVSDMDRCGR